MLKFLQSKKYDLKTLTSKQQSTLHMAADHGNQEAVEWLVKQGINPNLYDLEGHTAEDLARLEGHKDIEVYLLGIATAKQSRVRWW